MEEGILLNVDPGWQLGQNSLQSLRRRQRLWLALSAAAHVVVLVVLCWPATPAFVHPVWLARGQNGSATPDSVTLYLPQEIRAADHPLLSLNAASRQKQTARKKLRKRTNALESEKPATQAEAGSWSGSSLYGESDGDEVKPGFAIRFTDPRISRSAMPSGLQGDVVVELTIDSEGNVIAEKLLQGLGHGIDEMVISTLRDWHFRPATRNGVAIPFKYDAHFHFPS